MISNKVNDLEMMNDFVMTGKLVLIGPVCVSKKVRIN